MTISGKVAAIWTTHKRPQCFADLLYHNAIRLLLHDCPFIESCRGGSLRLSLALLPSDITTTSPLWTVIHQFRHFIELNFKPMR